MVVRAGSVQKASMHEALRKVTIKQGQLLFLLLDDHADQAHPIRV